MNAVSQNTFAKTMQIAEKHIGNKMVEHLVGLINSSSQMIKIEHDAMTRYCLFSPFVKGLSGDEHYYPFLDSETTDLIRQRNERLISLFGKLHYNYDLLVFALNGLGEKIRN